MRVVAFVVGMLILSGSAEAADCGSKDNAELCRIGSETRADNPAFGRSEGWAKEDEEARLKRHAARRVRAREILNSMPDPTWRDLFNAGYTIGYGHSPEERLFALGIAIRALSLAPNEPSVRLLVSMTTDAVALNYVGAQLYGRQKFFKLNPDTAAIEFSCLPQMLEPALPPSVGLAFDEPSKGFKPCPKGVGEVSQAPAIGAGE